jgi:uncharacterized membrane protein YphA (DoxX/SURF4 family)
MRSPLEFVGWIIAFIGAAGTLLGCGLMVLLGSFALIFMTPAIIIMLTGAVLIAIHRGKHVPHGKDREASANPKI